MDEDNNDNLFNQSNDGTSKSHNDHSSSATSDNNIEHIDMKGIDEDITMKEKIKIFVSVYWRGLVIVITPLVIMPLILPFPGEPYKWCAYTLVIMAIFWMTECIPLPITSFLPLLIFPLTNVLNTSITARAYMNDAVMMFLGSIILAYSVEQSGLHRRLALCTIRIIGYSHYKLLLGLCLITTFVSMWITNTAATTMMIPIIFAILKVLEDQKLLNIYEINPITGDKECSDIASCYFCSASFSATIGGVGTLVGTVTNLVFKGLFQTQFKEAPEYLSFPLFSAFTVPYMIVMEACLYFYLIFVYMGWLRPTSPAAKSTVMSERAIEVAKQSVNEQWIKIGKMTFWEVMVIILFSSSMVMFFTRSPQIFLGWGDIISNYFNEDPNKVLIMDSTAAMFVAFLMFLLPSTLEFFKNFTAKYHDQLPNKPVPGVLNWKLMNSIMPYSFMFLLGGGFALSTAAKPQHSNLNGKIGIMLKNLQSLPNILVLLIVVIFTTFITNFASNVAICNVVAPLAMQLAIEIGQNPLSYVLAAGLSASYCFMLPVGTPGNLIVQSAANMPTKKMMKAGLGPTISSMILTWLAIAFWAPIVWPALKETSPDWIKTLSPK